MNKYAIYAAAALAASAAGFGLYALDKSRTDASASERASRREAPIVVAKATAARGKVPVVIMSVGSASAQAFAQVKPRVDGMLLSFEAKEGTEVKAGDPIAKLDSASFEAALAQARGALERDQAQLSSARAELERAEKLYAKDAISKQAYLAQETSAKQLAGTVAIDQAAVKTAELNLSWTVVRAPISGRLGIRSADPGNMARASDANGIATIASTADMGAVFSIPAESARGVERGSRVLAYDKVGGKLLGTGAIQAMDNQIDAATGTLKVRAVFPSGGERFIANEFLQIKVLGRETEGLVVPANALAMGSSGSLAWTIDPQTMKAKPVNVKVVASNDEFAVVEGLSPGALLAADGLDKLRSGSNVRFVDESDSAPSPDKASKQRQGKPGAGKPQGPAKPGSAQTAAPEQSISADHSAAPATSEHKKREAASASPKKSRLPALLRAERAP